MKVILDKDLSTLGEEGDVKEVAKGYARNFLFPRSIAVPYTAGTIRMFEARKSVIEARKEEKRKAALSIKERLEAAELAITMPAGATGKLYGAVTSQSLMDELAKQGFEIERKRIEIPGNSIKSVGKFKFAVKLYGNTQAELSVTVTAEVKKEEKPAQERKGRRNREEFGRHETETPAAEGNVSAEGEVPSAESAAPTVDS